MATEFQITREIDVRATPEQLWEAVTTGNAGWLWPMELEPREGGAAAHGAVVEAWDPPRLLRVAAEDRSYALEERIERVDAARTRVAYTHSGVLPAGSESQLEPIELHNEFYLDALRRYAENFSGLPAAYAAVDAGPEGADAGALDRAARALGLAADAEVGDALALTLGEAGAPERAVLDYANGFFLGVRTPEAMYRLFGRNRFGGTLGLAVHDFAPGATAERAAARARSLLARLLGG